MDVEEYKCVRIKQYIERISGVDNIALKTRKRKYVELRKIFSVLCREFTNAKYVDIGVVINQDHTTVIHSINAFRNDVKLNQIENADIYNRAYAKFYLDSEKEAKNQELNEISDLNLGNLLKLMNSYKASIRELELKVSTQEEEIRRIRKILDLHNLIS